MELNRWDKWYSRENLSKDARILAAPPSRSADMAANEFQRRGKSRILDLACGVGRDTFFLEAHGLQVVGVDGSYNALVAAHQIKIKHGYSAQLVVGDAHHLPFENGSFEGVYCYGLLHEFTSPNKERDIKEVILEARRLVSDHGLLIITTLAGDPESGLPQVQLFTRQMFEQALAGWQVLEIREFDDIGCTNRADYHIWYGIFEK